MFDIIENADGCQCVNCVGTLRANHARTVARLAGWSWIVNAARADRARRVSRREPWEMSLTQAAHVAGIVPHADNDAACRRAQVQNRLAAAVAGWQYRHPQYAPMAHGTAWALVA